MALDLRQTPAGEGEGVKFLRMEDGVVVYRVGSWQAEAGEDARYGNTYTTAPMVLALTTPDQLLPIYPR